MSKKVSPAGLFQALTLTLKSGLRSGLFQQTTVKQPGDLTTETMPLEDDSIDRAIAPTESPTKKDTKFIRLGQGCLVLWALVAGLVTAIEPESAQYWERQIQSAMLRIRGAVATPDKIVILAIDDETLLQLSGSGRLPRRSAYAKAIDRVMQSGAKAVGVDLILDLPSFGETEVSTDCTQPNQKLAEDDRQLQQVLQRYGGRITLAVETSRLDNRQGEQMRLSLPFCPFRAANISYGLIEYPKEANEKIHRLGSAAVQKVRSSPEMAALFDEEKILPFADAVLRSANLPPSTARGENLFLHGGDGTFSRTTIPFWNVLSEENWNSDFLKRGQVFKDKIVLIGVTASNISPSLNTAVGMMPGIELNANAIATLLENKSIRNAFPNSSLAGLAIAGLVLSAGFLQMQTKRPTGRLGWAGAIALFWAGIGYATFTQGLMILPIAVPIAAMLLTGVSFLGTGLAHEYRNKLAFRKTLKQFARAPLVQELIRDQEEFQTLLQEHEQEILGKQLGGRYKITKVLGSGGFGETYIAEDSQRPGNPACVVKHLRPASNNPRHLQLARRLFRSEAQSLERLGEHDQIPRLLAYFEEDGEFYLIQEFIAGSMLSEDLTIGRHLPESRIVPLLQDLLQILDFVHSRNVIHRDIKPSNIIVRSRDKKLVLIDFGAVKELHQQLAEGDIATATIGIGTQGYMPPEQCAGNPRLNSDLYAVGMIGIQALTGLPPSQLQEDPETGEIAWRDRAIVSGSLAAILSKLVHRDYRSRYQSAKSAIEDLAQLTNLSTLTLPPEFFVAAAMEIEEDVTTTRPWPETFGEEELPPTEAPPEV
ncbi:CHASE2 domain-containing protein [Leptolyngbya boryana CZ1]|uniref:non-specific serine/threonine protein kinase n=1 Tax=Leptolyngbya boryana CZ1 TaxID=3060204 RepID=A0AA97AQ78_LEPBY|nr:CHASE2 domain-containing protein [Leptolyngbya boryana]WNZ46372.1 CHASE2 domain-containing protein [Leptolyngbya boryana CZ1]